MTPLPTISPSSAYQTANNWKTLYNNGTMQVLPIEGSDYEL